MNGFWASLGPGTPHTAYSAAKFAVKGFTEALITDLRLNAPHVKVSLVMPGHIGTSIFFNTAAVLGRPSPKEMTAEDLRPMRERFGAAASALSDDQLRAILQQIGEQFRDQRADQRRAGREDHPRRRARRRLADPRRRGRDRARRDGAGHARARLRGPFLKVAAQESPECADSSRWVAAPIAQRWKRASGLAAKQVLDPC